MEQIEIKYTAFIPNLRGGVTKNFEAVFNNSVFKKSGKLL